MMFVPLEVKGKASSFDSKQDGRFTPLAKTRKAATFAGDEISLSYLRRRIEKSNFVVRAKAPLPVRTKASSRECVAIVDAFSTGACIAYEASQRGYAIIHVLSLEPSDELAAMVPAQLRGSLPWVATFHVATELPLETGAAELAEDLAQFCACKGYQLVALAAGAETGVKLADLVSDAISTAGWAPRVRTNGASLTEARRNKAEMGEAVRRAGTRAVRQLRADSFPPVERWLATEWGVDPEDDEASCLLIVKPLESAGSDGVTACRHVSDVRRAVDRLVGSVNGLGQINEGVLVQEFLVGTEYVVDAVSRDGDHKVVAIWVYDRRPTNGAGFVLHGQTLVGSADPVVADLVPYAKDVLDALELKHGPSHMEIKLCPPDLKRPEFKTPCLVEVGARCHGAEGFWMSIADECCRKNQAVVALEAFVGSDQDFANLPPLPPPALYAAGCIKYLLTHKAGTLEAIDPKALNKITNLPSYRGHEIFVEIGKKVIPTKDCFSWGGCCKLTHVDRAQLEADYRIIADLCISGLWHIV